VCTPSHPDPRDIVNELAAKHGVRPPDATGPLQVLDEAQARQARSFIGFKSQDHTAQDEEVGRRGARILRSLAGDDSRVRVWGLPDDPADPAAADFSDVTKSVDADRAARWPSAPVNGSAGRHERA
jgi:hypothetical protein